MPCWFCWAGFGRFMFPACWSGLRPWFGLLVLDWEPIGHSPVSVASEREAADPTEGRRRRFPSSALARRHGPAQAPLALVGHQLLADAHEARLGAVVGRAAMDQG